MHIPASDLSVRCQYTAVRSELIAKCGAVAHCSSEPLAAVTNQIAQHAHAVHSNEHGVVPTGSSIQTVPIRYDGSTTDRWRHLCWDRQVSYTRDGRHPDGQRLAVRVHVALRRQAGKYLRTHIAYIYGTPYHTV